MSNIETLLGRLDGVRQTAPDQWMTRCSAHDDRHPSLSIRALPDGKLLIHCHAGCSPESVVSAIGMQLYDLMGPRPRDTPDGHGGFPAMHRPQRQRAEDILRVMAYEALVVAVAAEQLGNGDILLPEDYRRVLLAAKRLYDAAQVSLA